jgi:hypothetical protein
MLRGAGVRGAAAWVLAVGAVLLGAGAPAAGAAEGMPSRAAYLAEHLRENPVYVTDQVPRSIPRSTAPRYAKIAHRTGVPTYVVLLPDYLAEERGMLAAVHDRLGRKGLYVLLDESGVQAAQGYGVHLPVGAAWTATVYGVPYDAGTAASFDYFVDVLTSGHAARTAAQQRRAHAHDDPGRRWTSETDRRNQAVLTGFLMSGVALSVLLAGRYVLARRRGRDVEAALARLPRGAKPTQKVRADARHAALQGQRRVRRAVRASAAVSVVALGVAAQLTFSATRSGPVIDPTHADMTARPDRVAHGLAHDPLYVDPESPPVLTGRQADALRKRVEGMKLPVRVVVMPKPYESPSAGDTTLFAQRIHARTGVDAVYVMVDPTDGDIEIKDEGSPLDADRFALPQSVAHGKDVLNAADDVSARLDTLLTDLAKAPTGGRGGFPQVYEKPENPHQPNALPSLWAVGDFWGGLLLLGPIAAFLVWLLVVSVTRIACGPMRGREAPETARTAARRAGHGSVDDSAPPRPSTRWLRRAARTELDGLTSQFAARESELKEGVRTRVWECLDAATLYADLDGDRRLDADADAERLACVLVLLRLGAAALHTGSGHAADRYCGVNPLHGPAPHTRKPALPGAARPTPLPVCGSCRNLSAKPHAAARLDEAVLHLPATGKGTAVRYDQGAGPLAAAGGETDRLVNDVREILGVH